MGGANFWWQKVKTSGVEKSMCFQHVKELKDVFLHEMIISMRNMTTKAPDVGLCAMSLQSASHFQLVAGHPWDSQRAGSGR
jgi:hypothetical protein